MIYEVQFGSYVLHVEITLDKLIHSTSTFVKVYIFFNFL